MQTFCQKTFKCGRRAGHAAFTLIEVMIAGAVAAIVLTAVYVGVASSFNMLTATRQNLRATQIMISRCEGLRLELWGTNQLFNSQYVPTSFTESFYPLGLNTTTNVGITYYGKLTITTPIVFDASQNSSYRTNMALVTVTLNWTNGTGQANAHTRYMSTYVAQYGVQNYIYNQ